MQRHHPLLLSLLVVGPVFAQSEPPRPAEVTTSPATSPAASPAPDAARPGEILIDPKENASNGESTRVALPPEGPGREAFLKDIVRVNQRENVALVGPAGRELSAQEFYARVDRPDLVARSQERSRQRVWLLAGAGVVLAGSIAGGVVVHNNAQDLNDPRCFRDARSSYNDCVDRSQRTTAIGTAIIAAGAAAAGGLVTWAFLVDPMVTAPDETVRLATDYNRRLAARNGAPADTPAPATPAPATGLRWNVTPSIGPGGASLAARLEF